MFSKEKRGRHGLVNLRATQVDICAALYYLRGHIQITEDIMSKPDLANDDKRFVWHPFTQMKDWESEEPLIIERGKGSYLYDIEGKRYIDGVSSLWVNVHGHRKKEIDRAVNDQLKRMAHSTMLGLSHPGAIELARRLVEISPEGLERVFYSDSGSTAVEVGLKMAFQYWRHKGDNNRTKFLCLADSYHGDTLGSVSVGGIDLFHETFRPLLFETIKVPAPHCYRCPLGLERDTCGMECAEKLSETMREHRDELAGFIIEPLVQGAAGMVTHPEGYLRKAREFCDRDNVLMIADEVATGFGRTGRMFACEHESVSPDIMCLAKGITGGYLPLAATLTNSKVYEAFLGEYKELKTFFHGHTYTGNPLACAAAIANIDLFESEDTLGNVREREKQTAEGLRKIARLKHVGDVRQRGLMVGIELVADSKRKAPYPLEEKRGIKTVLEARDRGVIIRPLGNVVVLMPPLSISKRELAKLLKVTYYSIKKSTG